MRRRRTTTALGRFSLVPGVGGGGGTPIPYDPDQATYYVLEDAQGATLVDAQNSTLTAKSWP